MQKHIVFSSFTSTLYGRFEKKQTQVSVLRHFNPFFPPFPLERAKLWLFSSLPDSPAASASLSNRKHKLVHASHDCTELFSLSPLRQIHAFKFEFVFTKSWISIHLLAGSNPKSGIKRQEVEFCRFSLRDSPGMSCCKQSREGSAFHFNKELCAPWLPIRSVLCFN